MRSGVWELKWSLSPFSAPASGSLRRCDFQDHVCCRNLMRDYWLPVRVILVKLKRHALA